MYILINCLSTTVDIIAAIGTETVQLAAVTSLACDVAVCVTWWTPSHTDIHDVIV